MRITLTVVLALLAVGTAALIAQGGMRPGRWETTMRWRWRALRFRCRQ